LSPPAAPIPAPCPRGDRLDEVLAKAGLTRDSVRYTAADWSIFSDAFAHDPYRLPFFDAIHDEPLRAPSWARGLVSTLDAAAASSRPLATMIQLAARALGHEIDACATPSKQGGADFLVAMTALFEGRGAPDEIEIAADASDLPLDLQQALAPILRAAKDVADARDRAFSRLGATLREQLFFAGHGYFLPSIASPPRLRDTAVQRALTTELDMLPLYTAAARLAATVEAAALKRFVGLRGVSFSQPTPLGRVVVRDAENHEHAPDDPELDGDILLLIDTGGNDTYRIAAGATQSLDNPVSVLIDLAGDDRYTYDELPDPNDGARLPSDEEGRYASAQPVTIDNGPVSLSTVRRQGAGNLGVGLLFDFGGGQDQYRSLRLSQGSGVFGVGALFDEGGDDTYEAEAGVQGSAAYGIGILLDASGHDTYRGVHALQGFAWVKGAGLLYDRAGNDRYLADVGDPARGGDPLYFTPQLPGRGNASFAQGVGFGRRADAAIGGDGVYQSGGLGVLRDREGNDAYQASVFGTGSGYWFGTGVLADGAGNDTYDGLWYVQGSAAHFALTVFLDDAGNDNYNQRIEPVATSVGVGHDMSVAWHVDLGGDDRVRGPGLSLGSGNVNGMGFFVNVGGNDVYTAAGEPTLGAGNLSGEANQPGNARRDRITVGAFVDVGGLDTYRVGADVLPRNDSAWQNNRDPDPTLTTEHGAGLDAPTGDVCLGP
jgi:hypothetical protein